MDEAVKIFINFWVMIGMFAALMLPILAVPYLFIKMGSVAGKVQAKVSGMTKTAAKNSAPGQALAQRRNIRNNVRADRGRRLLSKAGPLAGGGLRNDSRAEYAGFVEKQRQEEVRKGHSAIEGAKISAPGELEQLARGQTVRGVRSTDAVRSAAVQKLIQAGHAEELTNVFQDGNAAVRETARSEVQRDYNNVSGFAGHLTKVTEADVSSGPVSAQKMEDYAVKALAEAKPEKVSTQDPHTWNLAARGAPRNAAAATALRGTVAEINGNQQLLKNMKPESRTHAATI